jgi:hypothetical protein
MQYADRLDLTGSQSPEQVGRAIAALADDSDLLNLTRRAFSIDAPAQPYRVDVWSLSASGAVTPVRRSHRDRPRGQVTTPPRTA